MVSVAAVRRGCVCVNVPTHARAHTRARTWALAAPVAVQMYMAIVMSTPIQALDNGLGQRPPLGWSTWNYFANDINETVIREMAEAMVETGLAKVGYEYINVDAGYLTRPRDSNGHLVVDPHRFPSGMKALGDYIHSLGLKLGVYTDITDSSCGRGPGSGGHYDDDAATFAGWGADYLKVDYCGNSVPRDPNSSYTAFAAFRDALNKTGRPIYYSICPHAEAPEMGTGLPYHGASVYSPPLSWTLEQRHALANSLLVEYTNNFDLWYADPTPAGDGGPMHIPGGVLTNIDSMVQMTNLSYSGPGSWNDADMLQLCEYGEGATRHFNSTGHPGNLHGIGLTFVEYQAHLAIWAIMASPLILSADLRTVGSKHPECLELMLNEEILAINQDDGGFAPTFLYGETNVSGVSYEKVNSTGIIGQAWSRILSGGRYAVVLFNRAEFSRSMSATWAQIGIPAKTQFSMRNVIAKTDLGTVSDTITAAVDSHAVLCVVLTPIKL